MTSELLGAIERLQIDENDTPAVLHEQNIDGVLFQTAPRKRVKPNPDALKAKLEKKYLTPPTALDGDWLDRLQQ
jgi:hypothetical protein